MELETFEANTESSSPTNCPSTQTVVPELPRWTIPVIMLTDSGVIDGSLTRPVANIRFSFARSASL